MQQFSYTARNRQGSAETGVGEAVTAAALAVQLAGRGLTPVAIAPRGGGTVAARRGAAAAPGSAPTSATAAGQAAGHATTSAAGKGDRSGGWMSITIGRKNLRPDPRITTMALRELAALLKAGIPIMRSLRLVADTSTSPALRSCFEHLIVDLDGGRDLTGAMEREMRRSGAFERYDVAMVAVGEHTGRLDRALQDLFKHREFMRQTAEQVGGALRYPIFVVLTCVLALVVINMFVIPSFAKVFANLHTELPLLTRVLLASSQWMLAWWPAMIGGSVGGLWLFRRWAATPAGRLTWDRVLLKIPLVGPLLYRVVLSRFASSLASSINSGLTITVAIQATSQTLGNAHVAAALERLQNSVERGESLSRAAAAAGVFPPALLQILAIGEESGTLGELLHEMGVHYHGEVEHAVKRLSASLEPLLVVVFGGMVLVMALGVFLPMWELGRASLK